MELRAFSVPRVEPDGAAATELYGARLRVRAEGAHFWAYGGFHAPRDGDLDDDAKKKSETACKTSRTGWTARRHRVLLSWIPFLGTRWPNYFSFMLLQDASLIHIGRFLVAQERGESQVLAQSLKLRRNRTWGNAALLHFTVSHASPMVIFRAALAVSARPH